MLCTSGFESYVLMNEREERRKREEVLGWEDLKVRPDGGGWGRVTLRKTANSDVPFYRPNRHCVTTRTCTSDSCFANAIG